MGSWGEGLSFGAALEAAVTALSLSPRHLKPT